MSPKVIGLIGENGSGKGTVISILKEIYGEESVAFLTYSNFLAHILDYFDLPRSRKNMQALATFLRSVDANALSHKVEMEIQNLISQGGLFTTLKYIVIDGIRKEQETRPVRNFNGKLIYITADPKIRFGRLSQRTEKSGERNKDFEKFLKEDIAEADKDIPVVGKTADIKIDNNGTIEDLRKKIIEIKNLI